MDEGLVDAVGVAPMTLRLSGSAAAVCALHALLAEHAVDVSPLEWTTDPSEDAGTAATAMCAVIVDVANTEERAAAKALATLINDLPPDTRPAPDLSAYDGLLRGRMGSQTGPAQVAAL